MASRVEKIQAFYLGAVQAVKEGYDFPSMAAFVTKYVIPYDVVPEGKIGNPQLLAEWGRKVLTLVREGESADTSVAPCGFPQNVPDTRKPTIEEKLAAAKAKKEKTEADRKKASAAVLAGLANMRATILSETPVNHAGDSQSQSEIPHQS